VIDESALQNEKQFESADLKNDTEIGIQFLERFHIDAVSESGEPTNVSKASRKLLGFDRRRHLSCEIH
jgi:hypothetical protein